MARSESKRIYLESGGKIYNFLSCKIEPNDGSFYISLLRKGENVDSFTFDSRSMIPRSVQHDEPRKKLKRISYHASGCVLFRNTDHSSIFFEPISKITTTNSFASWSIPEIEKLDEAEEISEDGLVASLPNPNQRYDFHFILAPWNSNIPEHHIAIRYEGLFSFIILPVLSNYELPKEVENCFTTMVPSKGIFDTQTTTNDQALIDFHQRINNTRDLIVYSPNKEGIFKIICAVPMRVGPKLEVMFFDDSLSFELVNSKNNVVKFKVKNKHGQYLKNEVPIKGIALDSEL